MTFSRGLVLCARVAAASGWALSLVVLGLWMMTEGRRWLDFPRLSLLFWGLCVIAAGILVFMVMVADRLVPGVGRRQSMWPLERAVMIAGVVCLTAALVSCRGAS